MSRTITLPFLHAARVLPRRTRRPVDVVVRASMPVAVEERTRADAEGEIRIAGRAVHDASRIEGLVFDGRLHVPLPGRTSPDGDLAAEGWTGDLDGSAEARFRVLLDPVLSGAGTMSGDEYDAMDVACTVWSGREAAQARAAATAEGILLVDGVFWTSLGEPVHRIGPKAGLTCARLGQWWTETGGPFVRLGRILAVPDLARVLPTVRGDVDLVRWRFPDWRHNAHASIAALASRPSEWSALAAEGFSTEARAAADAIRNGTDAEAAVAVAGWTSIMKESVDADLLDPVLEGVRMDPEPLSVLMESEGVPEALRLLAAARDQMVLDGYDDPWTPVDGLADVYAFS